MATSTALGHAVGSNRYPTTVLITLFLVAAISVPGLQFDIGPVPIYLVDVLGLTLVCWTVAVNDFSLELPNRRLVAFFALFLLATVPALIQGLSLSGFSILYVYTTGRLVLNVAVPLAVMASIRNRAQLSAAVTGVILGTLAVSLVGVLQVAPVTDSFVISLLRDYYPANGFSQYRLTHHSYAFATWYTATPYAGVLAMTLIFPLVLWLRSGRTRFALVLGVAFLAFVLAETRHAVIAIAPVLLFFGLRAINRRQGVLLGVGSAVLVTAVELLGLEPSPTRFLEDFVVLFEKFAASQDIGVRIESYRLFFDFLFESPIRTLVGFGPDVQSIVGRETVSPILSSAVESIPITSILAPVILYGIAGTVAYFAILLCGIKSGIGYLSQVEFDSIGHLSTRNAIVYAATASLVVALFLHPFDQYFARGGVKVRYILWTILAIQQSAMSLPD